MRQAAAASLPVGAHHPHLPSSKDRAKRRSSVAFVSLNLTPENAALVADHFFRDSDVLTYSEFMNEVAVVTQEMSTTGRVDKGGGGQSRTH